MLLKNCSSIPFMGVARGGQRGAFAPLNKWNWRKCPPLPPLIVPAKTTEEYFKFSIYLPYLDSLLQSIKDRFEDNLKFFSLLSILPPNKPENLNEVEKIYGLDNLAAEVRLWKSSLKNSTSCSEGSKDLYCEKEPSVIDYLISTKDVYPNVHKCLEIICVLSATSVEAERSFSCMRNVKT